MAVKYGIRIGEIKWGENVEYKFELFNKNNYVRIKLFSVVQIMINIQARSYNYKIFCVH